jgi:archaellum component FlaC
MASNDDIMLALGKLQAGVDRLRVDFQDEKQMAHESRAVIHQRLDSQVQQIAHMETTIAVSGQIDAQVRGEIQALKETVEKNQESVSPAIEDLKRMKTLGLGIAGLIALAGLTIGSIVMWASEAAVAAIRHWLRIP